MADFTMCKQEKCDKRNNCWRYTAPPNGDLQIYFKPSPKPDGSCLYYWPLDFDDFSPEKD